MSADGGIISAYHSEIAVSFNHVFFEDCEHEWDGENLTGLYDKGAIARHLGVEAGILTIFTARCSGIVRFDVQLWAAQPGSDSSSWDNVAEASLETRSGCLALFGLDDPESGSRISVPRGMYRVRVYSGGIETVDEFMTKGDDQYRIVLWPAPFAPPSLVYARIAGPW